MNKLANIYTKKITYLFSCYEITMFLNSKRNFVLTIVSDLWKSSVSRFIDMPSNLNMSTLAFVDFNESVMIYMVVDEEAV